MIKINLKIPRVFKGIIKVMDENSVVIQHPPFNCRVSDTLCALATSSAISANENTVIVCPDDLFDNIKFIVGQWIKGIKDLKKSQLSGTVIYSGRETGALVITKDVSNIPFYVVERVFVIEAQSFANNPASNIVSDKKAYSGHLTRKGHWLYELRKSSEVVDIPLGPLIESFPDLEGTGLKETDPLYQRQMLLKDVTPKSEISTFSLFAKRRIRIRTDKRIELLNEEQRKVAEQQYGTPIVPYYPTKLQKKYLALKRLAVKQGKKPWFILLKYRRGGFTTTEQAISYQMVNERPNSQVVTLADTAPKATRIFGMVTTMHREDPKSLKLIGDSKTSIELQNGSKFFIGTAGSRGLARGDTLQRAHWSEAAFSCPGPNQLTLVEDVKAGLIGAASNGEIILESTPNGKNFFYNDYLEAKKGLSEFTPLFVRWFDDPLNVEKPGTYDPEEINETLTIEELELISLHNLSLGQIAFRRNAKKTYKALFPQEFPEDDESCFISSGTSYFDISKIIEDLKEENTPEETRHIPGGSLVIWEKPVPGVSYSVGADTSEGLGPPCDPNGGIVIRNDTGEEVALLYGRFHPKKLAKELVELSIEYNNALLGIERNNHGHAVLMAVKDLGYGKSHWEGGYLYHHANITSGSKVRPFEEQKPNDSRAGWDTNTQTRPLMLSDIQNAYDESFFKPKSKVFLQEASTFTLIGNKWQAAQGMHDDVIVMAAIAWQMRNIVPRSPGMFVV